MKHHYPDCTGGPDCDCDERDAFEKAALKITTRHPESRRRPPVVVDSAGNVIDSAEAIRLIRRTYGLSTSDMGEITEYSRRTVEDWEQGRRRVPVLALLALKEWMGEE